MLGAEAIKRLAPRGAGRGLKGAWSVVETGVDDAAVVTGLVACQLRFFFEEDDFQIGVARGDCQGGGAPDDSPSDNGQVSCCCHGFGVSQMKSA